MNICVFCSAQNVSEAHVEAVRELGKRIGKGGHTLIWGGSDRGLMKVIADSAHEAGARIVGISMDLVRDQLRTQADEMVVAEGLGERKALMLERSDGFVVTAGGIGTLDEVMSILELKKHHVHEKPVVMLNTEDYYGGFKTQLERMVEGGFVDGPLDNLVHFAETPDDAIRYIEAHAD